MARELEILCRSAAALASIATMAALVAGCSGCPSGTTACGGGCIDVQNDRRNCGGCGVVCFTGECRAGRCECPEGTRPCAGECVEWTDARHCGECHNACIRAAQCDGTACSCPAGTDACLDGCADLAADPLHCGACGRACTPGQACERAVCQCPDPSHEGCPSGCVDTSSDLAHCGGCDVRCPLDASCRGGACECPAGRTACGDSCVFLATSAPHCGACGAECAAPRICVGGECRCPAAGAFCAGACVDTELDRANCGSCGSICGAPASCIGGRCVPGYRWHTTLPSGGTPSPLFSWDGRVAVSPDGSVYLAYSSPGGSIELIRFAPDGAVAWRRVFVTIARAVGDIAAAADGSVVLVASYESSFRSPGRATHTGRRLGDVAIVSLDAAGVVRWERFVDSDGNDFAGGVAIAPGRVVVSGSVAGTVDYGGGPIWADTFRDAFVLELEEASGSYVDAHVYGDVGTEEPVFVALAPDGDVVLAGFSGAGVDFGGGRTTTFNDGFVTRLSPTYAHRWSRAVRSRAIHGVAVDAAGHVYLSGENGPSADLRDGVRLAAAGTFVLAIEGTSGRSRWAATVAEGYVDVGRGPVVDAGSTLWVGASNSGPIGTYDAILAAYDAAGAPRFVHAYGSARTDLVTGIATAGSTLAFAGRFGGTATFGGRAETPTDFDVFLVVHDL